MNRNRFISKEKFLVALLLHMIIQCRKISSVLEVAYAFYGFMGYSCEKKGWRWLYDIESKKLFISRDVFFFFYETLLPFASGNITDSPKNFEIFYPELYNVGQPTISPILILGPESLTAAPNPLPAAGAEPTLTESSLSSIQSSPVAPTSSPDAIRPASSLQPISLLQLWPRLLHFTMWKNSLQWGPCPIQPRELMKMVYGGAPM